MDYTREPIIETIITPREGCKLVVRSSKASGLEEYFVDALEVVSFGSSFFFRSKERPKAFLVPCTDYEVLEVRETRMVLKNVAADRTIKIAGGKESTKIERTEKEIKEAATAKEEKSGRKRKKSVAAKEEPPKKESEVKGDKGRERKRLYKKRREGRAGDAEVPNEEKKTVNFPRLVLPPPDIEKGRGASFSGKETPKLVIGGQKTSGRVEKPHVPAPPLLISETISRYREDELFKQAFFEKGEDGDLIERDLEEHGRVQELLDEDEGEVELEKPASFPAEEEEEHEEGASIEEPYQTEG